MTKMVNPPTVVFIDDDKSVIDALKRVTRLSKFRCLFYTSPLNLLDEIEALSPDIVVSDIRMPEMSGIELLEIIANKAPLSVRVALSACDDNDSLFSAINNAHVWRYITKPWVNSEINELLDDAAIQLEKVRSELDRVYPGYPSGHHQADRFGTLLGVSEGMRICFRGLEAAARINTSVLLWGSPGTGKRTAARALAEKRGKFLNERVLNASDYGGSLVDSYLEFIGKLGTLVVIENLDELDPCQQVIIGAKMSESDINESTGSVVATFSGDPYKAIERDDLCSSLFENLFSANIFCFPDLSTRGIDVLLLADHFVEELNRQLNRDLSLSTEARVALLEHTWPGQVNEMRSKIQRAFAVCYSSQITEKDLGFLSPTPSQSEPIDIDLYNITPEQVMPLAHTNRIFVTQAVKACNNNIDLAAAKLSIAPSRLKELLTQWQEKNN